MRLDDQYGAKTISITGVNEAGVVTLVAAVSNARIWVLGYVVNAATAVTLKFQSKPAGTAVELTGDTGLSLGTNGTIASGYSPNGWFCTAVSSALQLTLGSTSAVSGHLTYCVEPASASTG